MLRSECSCTWHFLGSFGSGVLELGDPKVEEFCHAISGRISKYLNFLMNYILLNQNGSSKARNSILPWLELQALMVDPRCKIILLWRHRSEREAINPNSILSNFLRSKRAINFAFEVFQPMTYSDEKTLVNFYTRFEPEVWDLNPRKPCKISRTQ